MTRELCISHDAAAAAGNLHLHCLEYTYRYRAVEAIAAK